MGKELEITVYLGLKPAGLPEPQQVDELASEAGEAPPEIISGILHRGCKMVVAGTSKTNKTWSLLDMALSVASGQRWWGRETVKSKVFFVNFELAAWAMLRRVEAICEARPEVSEYRRNVWFWNLRGHSGDLSMLRPKLERVLEEQELGLVVLDPAYKLLGDRDENSNSDITSLMNEVEQLCVRTGAAVVFAHHFAKGDASAKSSIDRMSGAGAWGRDPDVILVMTPHEEVGCFSVSTTLRNLAQVPEFVMSWQFPLMVPAEELDPARLLNRRGRKRAMTDGEFVGYVFEGGEGQLYAEIVRKMEMVGVTRRTVGRYLERVMAAGRVDCRQGVYYVKEAGSC